MKRLTLFFVSFIFITQVHSQDLDTFKSLSFEELKSIIDSHFDEQTYTEGILPLEAYIAKAQDENIDTLVSEGLNDLGVLYWLQGNYQLAIDYFKKTKDLSETLFGKTDSRYANSLNNLAHLYQLMGKSQEALSLLIESMDILRQTVGENDIKYAAASNNLGIFYTDQGDYDKAEKHFEKSINIVKNLNGEEDQVFPRYLNNLAMMYRKTAQTQKALQLQLKAEKIIRNISSTRTVGYARTINNIAGTHLDLGNYQQALPLYMQSKEILESISMESHPIYPVTLNNLAYLYQLLNRHEESLKFHWEAVKIHKRVLGNNHPEYAISLINLARVLRLQQKYEEALPLLIQAKNIRESHYGQSHPGYAKVLFELAELFESKGDLDKALSYHIKAKNIRENILSEQDPFFLITLNDLARVHLKLNQYSQSKALLKRANNILAGDSIPLTFDEEYLQAMLTFKYNSYKKLELLTQTLDVAFQLVESNDSLSNKSKSLTIISEVVNELLIKTRNEVLNEKDKLRLLSTSHLWLQRSLSVLEPEIQASKAFELADQNKSVLLLQATKSESKYHLGNLPDSLIWQDQKLLKKQSELQAKLLENDLTAKTNSLLDEINEVNQQIDDFEKMLAKAYPKYHKIKYQQTDATVAEIQSSLDRNQALLEYVISDSTLHIFRIDPLDIQWVKVPVTSSEVNSRIQSLHSSLSNYESDSAYLEFTQQAHWFYKKLIAPVLSDQSGIKDLIIVPDGELAHLPFETFLIEPAAEEGIDYQELDYLLKEYNISYNYSATLWKENIEAPVLRNNGEIFGIAGNYQAKIDSSIADFRLPTDRWRRDELTPLPAAREEVALLQTKYQGYFAFDSLASEKNVKARVSDYSILHFATHGILDSERPMLSSLALSEDRDSTESNFWHAYEISKSRLNANMVVLSACETGYGKFETGNGVASLARAFMYAGAQSLVVSLWQVHDNSTSRLMNNFYDQLDQGLNKDEALKNAKMEYLKSARGIYAHPAFWSSFILMGKTDTVNIKSKGLLGFWGIGITILSFLMVGSYLLYRKKTSST